MMGLWDLQEERKLLHKENRVEAWDEADRKLCSPRNQMLDDFLVAARLICTSYFLFS